jgi:hypothetical protein
MAHAHTTGIDKKSCRARFRFSLRILLIGVAALCALLAWTVPPYQLVQERKAYWPRLNDSANSVRLIGGVSPPDEPLVPMPWIRWLMGDYPLCTMFYDPRQDKDGVELRRVRQLFPEANIWCWPTEDKLPEGMKPFAKGRRWIMMELPE